MHRQSLVIRTFASVAVIPLACSLGCGSSDDGAGTGGQTIDKPRVLEIDAGQQQERIQNRIADQRLQSHLSDFDISNPQVDLSKLLRGGPPKDGIPALVNSPRVAVAEADFPSPDGRVAVVTINEKTVGYPLAIMNMHEIANDVVGGVPIAAIYCPLCDSVSVVDRRIEGAEQPVVFGVSGLLYNSNVVMYDRTSDGLWSQVLMKAITGPFAGTKLKHYPVRLMTMSAFRDAHPDAEILSTDTGFGRDYTLNPYGWYFNDPNRVFHEFNYSDALPPKTLGLGIAWPDGTATFIEVDALAKEAAPITHKDWTVKASRTEAGVFVNEADENVQTMQTYFHSWSAFHPKTEVIKAGDEAKSSSGDAKSGQDGPPDA